MAFFFQVEKEIGEKRVMTFHGAGLSVAPKISFQEIAAASGTSEEVGVVDLYLCMISFYLYDFHMSSIIYLVKMIKSWLQILSITT